MGRPRGALARAGGCQRAAGAAARPPARVVGAADECGVGVHIRAAAGQRVGRRTSGGVKGGKHCAAAGNMGLAGVVTRDDWQRARVRGGGWVGKGGACVAGVRAWPGDFLAPSRLRGLQLRGLPPITCVALDGGGKAALEHGGAVHGTANGEGGGVRVPWGVGRRQPTLCPPCSSRRRRQPSPGAPASRSSTPARCCALQRHGRATAGGPQAGGKGGEGGAPFPHLTAWSSVVVLMC